MNQPNAEVTTTRPTLGQLTWVFFRIGNSTFGGGNPIMAALQREFVERQKWLTPEDYGIAYSLARITPGTNVIAFCTATGSRILGFPGALAGALGETAPSALLAVLLTQGYESWRSNPLVLAAVAGTIAAVAGMMWATIALILKPYLNRFDGVLRSLVFAVGAFVALFKFDLSPLSVIGLAILIGLVWTPKENAA